MKKTEFYERLLAACFTDSQSRTANIRNHEYIKLRDESIYKYQRKHDRYIKVSPYATDEDRILKDDPFVLFEALSKRDAGKLLNEQWDAHVSTWQHEGKTYRSVPDFAPWYANNLPTHEIIFPATDVFGEFRRDALICFYRGSLYYCINTANADDHTLCLFPFREDARYKIGEHRWADVKHLHAVWCEDDKRFV